MEFLKLKEAAARVGLSEQYLRKLCREKKIAHTVIGARYFLSPVQCDALVKTVEIVDAGEKHAIEKETGEDRDSEGWFERPETRKIEKGDK